MRESFQVGLAMAALVLVGGACKADHSTSSSGTTSPREDDPSKRATRLCERLVTAGVAKNCGEAEIGEQGAVVRFDVNAFTDQRGFARSWTEGNTNAGDALNLIVKADISVDDYPDAYIFSRENRLLVGAGSPDVWTKCLTANGCVMKGDGENATLRCASSVYAACAKQNPKSYAASKAFVEAAKAAVAQP